MTNLVTELVQRDQVLLRNDTHSDMVLRLEPWGTERSFNAGTTKIVARGPADTEESLEIAYSEQAITVYGWSGSVIAVFQDGNKIADIDLPAPNTPRLPNKDRRGV
jgi:hypothetical protein